ncbi:MAG: ABC transporter permease [candidate division KSB1 bacterium]|nr:ABC transporter permease [candidate division KSB1 bacterium]
MIRLATALWESTRLALQALWAHKMRAFLTVLGIVIGVTTITGIVSVIQGLNKAVYSQIAGLGADLLYVQKFPWVSGREFYKYRNRKDITTKEADALKRFCRLASVVSPMTATRRTVKYGSTKLSNVTIYAVEANYKDAANVLPEYGRFLTETDVERRHAVCVIGQEVASRLFERQDPIGRRITVGDYKFTVVGVLERQGEVLGRNNDIVVLVPLTIFQKLYGSRRSLTILVKVVDASRLEEAEEEIIGILRRVRRVPPDKENDFAINRQDILEDLYKNLTRVLYAVAFGIGALSLLVGGIGIMNIMLVSVTERTREIGIRKAIGARRSDIMMQFLVESVAISALGGLIGLGLGFGVGMLLGRLPVLQATIAPSAIVLGLGFSCGVGMFAGLYPAWKASRLDPIVALRYE